MVRVNKEGARIIRGTVEGYNVISDFGTRVVTVSFQEGYKSHSGRSFDYALCLILQFFMM